jgi:hypothetical protein
LGLQPRYSARFLSDAGRLAPARTQAWRDVVRVVRALEQAGRDTLPGAGDGLALLPRAGAEEVQLMAHGRQVPGRDLWVWYQATEAEIRLVALTRSL